MLHAQFSKHFLQQNKYIKQQDYRDCEYPFFIKLSTSDQKLVG